MKRTLALILAMLVSLPVLASCGGTAAETVRGSL